MVSKTISLSSSPSSIQDLESYLHEILDEFKFCEAKFPEILISLTEAVNNAIIHGNKLDTNKVVEVECKSLHNGIYFSIKDEGKGFDPTMVPDPTSDEFIECCGGRGVMIIQNLADKADYINNGNTLELYFNLGNVGN